MKPKPVVLPKRKQFPITIEFKTRLQLLANGTQQNTVKNFDINALFPSTWNPMSMDLPKTAPQLIETIGTPIYKCRTDYRILINNLLSVYSPGSPELSRYHDFLYEKVSYETELPSSTSIETHKLALDPVFEAKDFKGIISYLYNIKSEPNSDLYIYLMDNFFQISRYKYYRATIQSIFHNHRQIDSLLYAQNFAIRPNDSLISKYLQFCINNKYKRTYLHTLQLLNYLKPLKNNYQKYSSHPWFMPSDIDPSSKIRPYPMSEYQLNLVTKIVFHQRSKSINMSYLLNNAPFQEETMTLMDPKALFCDRDLYRVALRGCIRFRQLDIFKLLLQNLIFNSVIYTGSETQISELKICVSDQEIPDTMKAVYNAKTVQDVSLIFDKTVLKMILDFALLTKDEKVFEWCWTVFKDSYLSNMSTFKESLKAEVFDNYVIQRIYEISKVFAMDNTVYHDLNLYFDMQYITNLST
ncbi:BA75_00683T0 [Komagataella pastoris]|uniref:BA75_00683T0 n=1 Tax=Komagataella pastoris TaxID=4922 RepID=A0A1B2J9F9_PICPA|nr:BA75_00683T0 [Komagataella pastoris]